MPVVSRRVALWRARNYRYFIYALVDESDGSAHYIGRTRHPKQRLYAHRYDCNPEGLREWFATRPRLGIRVLDEVRGARAALAGESEWIQRGRELGWPIVNARNSRGGSLALGRKAPRGEWTLADLGLEPE